MSGSRSRFDRRSRANATFFLPVLGVIAVASSGMFVVAQEPSGEKAKKADAEKPAEKPAAKAPAKAAAKPKAGGVEWLTLDVGLAQVRQKRLPAVVLFDARSSAPAPEGADGKNDAKPEASPQPATPGFFDDHLADSSVKDVLKHFVLIRVTAEDLKKPYPPLPAPPDPAKKKGKAQAPPAGGAAPGDAPGADGAAANAGDPASAGNPGPTAGAKLGLGGERPSLVALSYWEEAVLTYSGDLPTRTKVKNDLGRIWKVNQLYANEAKRVDPEVEKSKYSATLGNQRDAVLKVRDFEGEKAQNLFDPVLKKKVNDLILDYRAKAQKAIAEADKLDAAKKYTQAIEAFDKVTVNFPFQDVMQQANKRKGECLRKLTFGG